MKYIFILMLSVALASCSAQENTSLTADEFEQQIKANPNAQILDVRTPGEFNSGHLKNALLADWRNKKEFNRRISFIDKDKPVLVYCLSGGRSAAAAEMMRAAGYKTVYELDGGLNAWRGKDKLVEGNSNAPQLLVQTFDETIQKNGLVLVDFGAEWCAPCKKMEPILNAVVQKKGSSFTLLKVDGGKDLDLIKKYQVEALPVFLIFKNGQQIWRKDGVATEAELLDKLQ
ncbi:MAG: thioredoxin domain-containing protein [Ferruginibacter sp.]